jgi:hypothetical protein
VVCPRGRVSAAEIQPGGTLGQRHEVEARMAPVPQHRLECPVQRQCVDDEIRLAGRSKRFEAIEAIEELQPRAGIAGGCGVQEDLPAPVRQCPEGPAVPIARRGRTEMGPVGSRTPAGTGIPARRNGPEFVETDHRAACGRLRVELNTCPRV